jgi:hypothetical protein
MRFLGKDAESYIAKNFVSFKGKCTEKDAVTDEMRRVGEAILYPMLKICELPAVCS